MQPVTCPNCKTTYHPDRLLSGSPQYTQTYTTICAVCGLQFDWTPRRARKLTNAYRFWSW